MIRNLPCGGPAEAGKGRESPGLAQEEIALTTFAENRAALVDYAARIVGGRESAEDVVQEAWLRLDTVVGTGRLEHPLGYLYRVVRNAAFDRVRRASLETRHFDTDWAAESVAEDRPTPEDELQHRQELAIVMQALQELPTRTRIAVELHRFRNCKLKEIAEHLGISVALAHALVYDGLDHCRRRVLRHS
jgi:RNA polymerase sigma factor (sigma-70 family)